MQRNALMPREIGPSLTDHYTVLDIRSRGVRYKGRNETGAATALNPGTCYGKGATASKALEECLRWCDVFEPEGKVKPIGQAE